MLEKFGFDSPESLKRFLVMLAGPALAFLNSKLGIGVPDTVVAAGLGLLAAYIWQSGHKAAVLAQQAGADAAAKVVTLDDAAKVLASKPTPPMAGTP